MNLKLPNYFYFLNKFYLQLLQVNLFNNFNKDLKKLLFLLILSISIQILAAILTLGFFLFYDLDPEIYMVISYVIGYFYIIGVVLQFISATIACRDRLQMISEKISFRFHLSVAETKIYIELSRKIFTVIKNINKFLTFPLIICFLLLLVAITFEFYGVMRMLYKNTDATLLLSLSGTIWTLIEIYPIFITIYFSESCWMAIDEIKETGYEILCHHRIFEPNAEKIFNYFVRSIEKQNLKLKTIFFDLDWKLFFEVN